MALTNITIWMLLLFITNDDKTSGSRITEKLDYLVVITKGTNNMCCNRNATFVGIEKNISWIIVVGIQTLYSSKFLSHNTIPPDYLISK
jgi:low affinity Fe/Cu permease